MKIKIDKNGCFYVDDTLKICPLSMKPCGTWCALFEWEYLHWVNEGIDLTITNVEVELCHNRKYRVSNENFTDERED